MGRRRGTKIVPAGGCAWLPSAPSGDWRFLPSARGVLGLGLSVVALKFINNLFADANFQFGLDLNMVGAGAVLSLFAGLIAGLYPAWRICRIQPAMHLKTQ